MINSASFLFGVMILNNRNLIFEKTNVWQTRAATSLETCRKYGNGSLGEAVGQMYVEKYFPAAAKERMVTLVKNLQTFWANVLRVLNG